MPIFEYRCNNCSNKFEELISGDRDRVVPCPQCGSEQTEKLMSAIGGISMGSSSAPACSSCCPSASQCPSAGSGGACCAGAG